MKPTNSIVQKKQEQTFSTAIRSDALQRLMMESLQDREMVADLTSVLTSVVAANEALKKCKPDSIVAAALQGAVMRLSLPLKQYSIVPYGDTASFQISYQGYAALAKATGEYDEIDVLDVREGEYKGKDPRTRKPTFEWIDDDDEREKKPIIGYYAYYDLKDGFSRCLYWTYEKILNHADQYSQAFNRKKWEDYVAGKIKREDIHNNSPWYGLPNSEGHMKMCKKTVLKQLLLDGFAPMSTKLMKSIRYDDLQERGGEVISADDSRIVNVSTGEIFDTTAVVVEEPKEEPAPAKKKEAQPKSDQPAVEQMTLEGMKG